MGSCDWLRGFGTQVLGKMVRRVGGVVKFVASCFYVSFDPGQFQGLMARMRIYLGPYQAYANGVTQKQTRMNMETGILEKNPHIPQHNIMSIQSLMTRKGILQTPKLPNAMQRRNFRATFHISTLKWLCNLPELTRSCFWIFILLPTDWVHDVSSFARCHYNTQMVACCRQVIVCLISK